MPVTWSVCSGDEMLNCIMATEEYKSAKDDEGIQKALVRGHLLLDEQLLEQPAFRELQDHSGSTAISALITPTKFYVANCGDSRSVLATDGKAVPMSFDHKPFNPEENRRIVAAGGTVSMKRVDGDLAVSRSLGDFSYKQSSSLPAEEQKVSAEPEIKVQVRNEQDEFLILACDGIWDVMSNEDCVQFVRQRLKEESDIGAVCQDLLDHCLNLNSRDNMSVALLVFPACKTAPAGTHAPRAAPAEEDDGKAADE